MNKETEKDISKIIIVYEDGETEEIEKGMVTQIIQNGQEQNITAEFANISGEELVVILRAFTEMYLRLNHGEE